MEQLRVQIKAQKLAQMQRADVYEIENARSMTVGLRSNLQKEFIDLIECSE